MDEVDPAMKWDADGDQSFSVADPKPAQWVRQLVDSSPIASVVSDPRLPDNPIVAVNQPFVDLTEYSAADILGRNCRFLAGDGTEPSKSELTGEACNLIFSGSHFLTAASNTRASKSGCSQAKL